MFRINNVPETMTSFKTKAFGYLTSRLGNSQDREDVSQQAIKPAPQRAKTASSPHIEVVKLETRRLDGSTCLALRPLMAAAWEKGADIIVLDLTEVVFIDSLGISALVSEQRKRPKGTRIVVSSLSDFVRDVLEVTQLVSVFDVFATASAAIESLAA